VELEVHTPRLAVCRLAPGEAIPAWVELRSQPLVSITATAGELSLVVPEADVPAGVQAETGWRALSVRGPLPFHLTGILASLATPLAAAGIPIFALSTYDTDWLLVADDRLPAACAALEEAGHLVRPEGPVRGPVGGERAARQDDPA
jgi:hypothetical protein